MTAIRGLKLPAAARKTKGLLQTLADIKIGGVRSSVRIKKRDLIYVMGNISTLVENGLTLPKALETISKERSLRAYARMLDQIRVRIESGETFSSALQQVGTFSDILINQVRVGERSGTLPETIKRITHQLEQADDLRSQILKKLAYPAMLLTLGTGAVSFMLLYVVPTFERTYAESGAMLPMITRVLIQAGRLTSGYGWMLLLAIAAGVIAFISVRRNPKGRFWLDTWLLRVPLIGDWLRNLAVLQFMEVLGNLMDSGFTIVDALKICASSVNNRAVRKSVEGLHAAILRGERFSAELEKYSELFPPVVNQLVIVGEKTGTLAKATHDIRKHLQREVQRYTSLMLGTIEPVLTVALAVCIGGILLAIYLPMFDMIGAMNEGPN